MKIIKKILGALAFVDILILLIKVLLGGGWDIITNGIEKAISIMSIAILGSENLIFAIALIVLAGGSILLSLVATIITLFQKKISGNVSFFSYLAISVESFVGTLFVISCIDQYSTDKSIVILSLAYIILIALFGLFAFIAAFKGDEVFSNIDIEGYNKYVEAQQLLKQQEREKAKQAKKSQETDFEIERNDEESKVDESVEEKSEEVSNNEQVEETQDDSLEEVQDEVKDVEDEIVEDDSNEEVVEESIEEIEETPIEEVEDEPIEEVEDELIEESSEEIEEETAPEETDSVEEEENKEEPLEEKEEETKTEEEPEEVEEEKEGPRVLEIEDDDVQDLSHVNKFVVKKSFEEQMAEREAQMAREKQNKTKEEKFDSKMSEEEKLEQRFSSFRDGGTESFELTSNDQSVLELTNEEVETFDFDDEVVPIDPANRKNFDDDDDEEDDESTGSSFNVNFGPAKSMDEKFDEADDQLKENYSKIKNAIMCYKKVTSRTSKSCETFRKGYNTIAKLVIRGKSIKVYLPLDPESLDPNVYHQKDASSIKKYEMVPTCIKVRSNLSCKKTIELLTLILTSEDIGAEKNKNYKEIDYTKSKNSVE